MEPVATGADAALSQARNHLAAMRLTEAQPLRLENSALRQQDVGLSAGLQRTGRLGFTFSARCSLVNASGDFDGVNSGDASMHGTKYAARNRHLGAATRFGAP